MQSFLKYLPYLIAAVVALTILLSGYVKAPPDKAYIISGLRRKQRILIGKAGIRIPFLSDYVYRKNPAYNHILVVNYAGIDTDKLPEAINRLSQII